MATLSMNGVSYTYPITGDKNWGGYTSSWILAVSASLQRNTGLFAPTQDVDFGSSKGLVTAYIKSNVAASAVASIGVLRLGAEEAIAWRTDSDNEDITLNTVGDALTFNGSSVVVASGTLTASNLVITDSSGLIETHPNVTVVEASFLNGVTSLIQTQFTSVNTSIDTKAAKAYTANRYLVTNSEGTDLEVQSWPRLYRTDVNPVSSDFPVTSNIFTENLIAYHLAGSLETFDGADYINDVDLTERGSTIDAGADAIGVNSACAFDGSLTLNSSDAAFNMSSGSENLTIGCWARRADWTDVSTAETLMSNLRVTADTWSGWSLHIENDYLYWQTFATSNTATSQVTVAVDGLNAGWHHFAMTRDGDASMALYIDGLRVAYQADTIQTLANGTGLEIGGAFSSLALDRMFTGRIDEMFHHFDKTYTNDQIARIYCRSSRLKATESIFEGGNGRLEYVSPQEGRLIKYFPYIKDGATPLWSNDIGTGTGGFDDRVSGYRVYKNSVYFEGDILCHTDAPTVSTQLYTSMPLPQENSSGLNTAILRPSAWLDIGTAYYNCVVQVTSTEMRWLILNAATAYGAYNVLTSSTPATWATNDGGTWSFNYPTASNKSV